MYERIKKSCMALGVVGGIAGGVGYVLTRIVLGPTPEFFLFLVWLVFFVVVVSVIEMILLRIFAPKFFKDYFSRKD